MVIASIDLTSSAISSVGRKENLVLYYVACVYFTYYVYIMHMRVSSFILFGSAENNTQTDNAMIVIDKHLKSIKRKEFMVCIG